MLKFLQRKPPSPVARSAPPGVRLYAIGDVHGRLDALNALLGAIGEDQDGCGARPVLVMLGDYVDRGPASREVIDRLVELDGYPMLETRFVRGNHDDTMLRFVTDTSVGPSWCGFGGGEALRSYGVAAPALDADAQAWADTQAAFAAALPPEHLRFLTALEPSVEYGDYFFTHAGVRPGVAFADQDAHDLMWIREEFLRGAALLPKTVVHGHTPALEPFVSDRRIGVDTGAYATGRLTAIVLEGTDRRLIQAEVSGGRTTVEHLDASTPAPVRRRG